LQADAHVAYDSFFLKSAPDQESRMVEVCCWAHARRHVYQALDHDPSRMRTLLLMIAELYGVEKLARQRGLSGEDLRLLRDQGVSRRVSAMQPLQPHSISTSRKIDFERTIRRTKKPPARRRGPGSVRE
jgi:hypothetical protein